MRRPRAEAGVRAGFGVGGMLARLQGMKKKRKAEKPQINSRVNVADYLKGKKLV